MAGNEKLLVLLIENYKVPENILTSGRSLCLGAFFPEKLEL